jgi:hypothetical protein
MKPLIEVTREIAGTNHSMYLRYATDAVAKTISLDDEHYVNVDVASNDEIVRIEIVFPDDQSVDLVAQFAHARGLSLAGVFDPPIAS